MIGTLLVLIAAYHLSTAQALFRQPRDDTHTLPGWKGQQEISVTGDPVVYGKEDWRGEIVQLSWQPRAYLLKNFLSDEECDHLIALAKPSMRKSSVADSSTGRSVASEVRTSTGTFLAKQQDEVVKRIEKRVAQVTMIPMENQEGTQILHYINGQQYKPHHDYFHDQINQSMDKGGQRLATVLMYLTTVEEGGETIFPEADRKSAGPEWSECAKEGMAVKTVKGNAVMFFSLHPDGTEDPSSLHGSCPTIKGEKWSATKWIHVADNGTTKRQQLAGWSGKDSKDCKDDDDECASWAELGECEKNAEFMKIKCRKSCQHC